MSTLSCSLVGKTTQVRIGRPRGRVELPERPFFVATLFVAPMSSTPERPHPLVLAYLQAAIARLPPL